MTIESVKALMFRCNSRARLRSRIGSWAILGLMFVVAASVPGASASTASRGPFGTPATQTSPNRLFFQTHDSYLDSIDVGTGLTRTWPLDLGDADEVGFDSRGLQIAITHDGQQVAYATRKDGRPWRLRVTDGASSREIGSLEGMSLVTNLAWSPDDREIAFLGTYEKDSLVGEDTALLVMNVASGEIEGITDPVYEFAWRPGSREIIYTVVHGAGIGVYVVDGTREVFRRLRHFDWGRHLTPSPDGRQLLYSPLEGFQRVFLNLESKEVRRLFLDAVWGPSAWSPDGVNIVVVQDIGTAACGQTDSTKGNLAIVDTVTGDARVLDGGVIPSPAWSPDGSSIAYLRVDSCEQDTVALTLVDVKSGEKRVLKSGLGVESDIWVWR